MGRNLARFTVPEDSAELASARKACRAAMESIVQKNANHARHLARKSESFDDLYALGQIRLINYTTALRASPTERFFQVPLIFSQVGRKFASVIEERLSSIAFQEG